jgi:hypothetical protein
MKRFAWSRRPKRRTVQVALLVTALFLTAQPIVWAQSPPTTPLPGTDTLNPEMNDDGPVSAEWYQTLPPTQPGFPVAVNGAYLAGGSSPTLVDLDGNGTLEIVLAGRNLEGGAPGNGGMVYVYRYDGSPFWQKPVRAPVNSTPTAADLNGDGHPDIVVGMGGFAETQHWNGGVIALDGLDGHELWTFDTQDWVTHEADGWLDGVFSTPAAGDVNGDGQIEITFGSWDQCIYLLDRAGHPLWGLAGVLPDQGRCGGHGFYNEDTIWSSPALADLTGDGRLEIIIGADVANGNVWRDPAGGYLYVLDADGNTLAREWMEQTVYSSPAAADLDKDGQYELVVGTGTTYPGKGYFVSAFDYDAAQPDPTQRLVLKWRQTTTGRVFASPAIADLNQDGWLDVAIASFVGDWGEDGTTLYLLRGQDGSPIVSPRLICNFMGQSQSTSSSTIVADIDGDNRPEILLSHAAEVAIFNHDGTYYTDYSNPQWPNGPENPACARGDRPTTGLTYWARWPLYATPAVADLDGDGDAEIVIAGHNPDNPNQGMLFAWTGQSAQIAPLWAMWRHDEYHTGNLFFELTPPANPTSLQSASHVPGTWSTSSTVQVSWSGATDRDSGVAGYSVVWDNVPDTLPDRILDLEASAESTTSPPLADGKGHYFHLRTADRAGNWTTDALHLGPFWIDSAPPASVASSPAVVTGPFQVTWWGSDATSGLSGYQIEVSDNGGPWTTWLHDQTGTAATYQGSVGHVYRFRSIATDRAGNVEVNYSSTGDTSTAVAKYLLSGTVYDERGTPLTGAKVVAQPDGLNVASTSGDGQFLVGLPGGGTYNVIASQSLHGVLPPMKGIAIKSDEDGLDLYLPAATNLIRNGDFESSDGWQMNADGLVPPEPILGMGHTGDYALQIGDLPKGQTPSTTWTWTARQTVSIPQGAIAETLDWCYRVEGDAASGDEFVVTVQGASSEVSKPFSLQAVDWTHEWIDVTGFAGQEVVVSFRLSREPDDAPLTVWLDEVGVGSSASVIYLPQVFRSQ